VRVKVQVGVAYGSPTRRVEELVLEVVRAHPATLTDPEPMVLFRDFAESCLLFEARFWITVRSLLDRPLIESDVRYAIDERFREEGISIAFPQRDVHLDTTGPIEVRLRE
jgi:small-conductance mechanosensitive channel